MGLVVGLVSSVLAQAGQWNREAMYATRDVEAADGKVRRVTVPLRNEITPHIKDIYAMPWVFRGDPDTARTLLKKALQLKPNHPRAVREMAMLLL